MENTASRFKTQKKLIDNLIRTLCTTLVISDREAELLRYFAAGLLSSLEVRSAKANEIYHKLVEGMTSKFHDLHSDDDSSRSDSKPLSMSEHTEAVVSSKASHNA
jgi:hypothetical protein